MADEVTERLLEAAKAAATKAYAPYSRFCVGAAALLENGQVVSGSNQENAAYPSGLCAERVTLFYANAQWPDVAVTHVLICALTDGELTDEPVKPCGACRQVLLEKRRTQDRPMKIIMAGRKGTMAINDVADLLPLSFCFSTFAPF